MVAKAMLLTSNRGFAECGEVFGAAVVGPRLSTPLSSSKIIPLCPKLFT
jgi:hypothetical protein